MKNLLFTFLFLFIVISGCADDNGSSDDAASDAGIEVETVDEIDDTSSNDDDIIYDSTDDTKTATNDDQTTGEKSGTTDDKDGEIVIAGESDTGTDITSDTGFPIPTDPITGDSITTAISKINLDGISNLIIQPQSTPSSKMYSVSGAVNTGLKTVVNGELVNIEIEGGFGKTPVKGFSIKGSKLLKAAVSFKDASGDITTCLVDQSNNCIEISLDPRQSSKFRNSDYFIEKSGRLYYLTEDGTLRSRNIIPAQSGRMLSISGDVTSDLAEDVDQFEIDASGDIMYESYGDVTLRHSDGTEVLVDGDYWDGRNALRLDAVSKKFFIGRQDRGFTFYSDQNFFGNIFFDDNGYPVISHAQPVAWDAKMNQGLNGVYTDINTNKSPSSCNNHTVNLKNIVICSNEIFVFGDTETDLSEVNLNYSLHSIFNLQIVASYDLLYMYSEDEFGIPIKLSKEDIFGQVSIFITDDYKINSDGLTVTPNNTLNFCGQRDGTDYIVQITNADTTPIITETPGECSSIVSLP